MLSLKLGRGSVWVAGLLCCAAVAKLAATRIPVATAQKTDAKARSSAVDASGCRGCHREAVDGFARSKMSHSLRPGALEPVGSVQLPGTTITMFSDAHGSWQKLESAGSSSEFHVDYVIGSGTHASGYIVDLGDHLFQSPVAYYRDRGAYGLAPGYEAGSDPDYTRPIAAGCLFCHSGSFNAVAGTQNEFGRPPFSHLAIGCDRCHGSATAHLAKPSLSNIVSPAHLDRAARDSICEQCHLIGVVRVLNPGRQFSDFRPGERLEDTFTIYRNVAVEGAESEFKVISHSEQLALSKCQRNSGGKLWCGTCHDPHDEPTEPVSYYRERCLLCHARTQFAADHPPKTSDCIGCHMPRRTANDGGHTVFTDHRIQRRPQPGVVPQGASIAAWRDPPKELATRNLGIATIEVGIAGKSPAEIVSGYRMLTSIQQQFPQDSDMFNSIGNALYSGKQYAEAVQAFELAVRFDPVSSQKETNLGEAYEALGERDLAERHLERAILIDPLNLDAATQLIPLYETSGKSAKADDLSRKIQDQIQAGAGPRR